MVRQLIQLLVGGCFLGVSLALAANSGESDRSETTFLIGGKAVHFLNVGARSLKPPMTLSKSCQKANGEFQCQAFVALSRASFRKITIHGGGADPGGLVCQSLGGSFAMGLSPKGDEQLFCLFSDGSMVSSDSLRAHARGNDRAHEAAAGT